MATKYRLLERAQIDGAVRDPGYVFELPEGVRGPHRSVITKHELHASSIDSNMDEWFTGRWACQAEDVPCFEIIQEAEEIPASDLLAIEFKPDHLLIEHQDKSSQPE